MNNETEESEEFAEECDCEEGGEFWENEQAMVDQRTLLFRQKECKIISWEISEDENGEECFFITIYKDDFKKSYYVGLSRTLAEQEKLKGLRRLLEKFLESYPYDKKCNPPKKIIKNAETRKNYKETECQAISWGIDKNENSKKSFLIAVYLDKLGKTFFKKFNETPEEQEKLKKLKKLLDEFIIEEIVPGYI